MDQIAERRHEPRLAINVEVFEQKSRKSLGHTADLNAYGMMLVGNTQFSVGDEIRVSLDIPNGKTDTTRTALAAQCRWSEPHMNTPFHNSGFKFVYPTKYDVEYIETLFFGFTK